MASTSAADSRPSAADSIVLQTAVTPPRPRSEHIRRDRLVAALDDDDGRRLTLVAGPPGFGKSTLLADWASRRGRVAWLSLDENDNDPARFVAHVVAALRRVEPELGERALQALGAPAADVTGVVLPLLLNDLASVTPELRLVIEDYHLIADPAVHQALAFLVEHAPASFGVVLSTRQDPPLPLGRLRARGELLEIRADDLRFSVDEARQFLVDALGIEIDAEAVDRLHRRTEGWPAALYLAALSLRGRPDPAGAIDRFAGDDRYVVDFLTSEILARQTPELRTFLLRTSILDRFCGPLCDAVVGRDDSAARLAEMERSNLLLVALDSRREWFRYHHLFRDLLRHELAMTDPAVVPELHRRASAWFRNAGYIVDAADHAIAAGDLRTVAELVGRHYALFVDRGQLATVIGWLRAIPEAAVADDWLLGFAGAVVYANAGAIEDAERWLRLAEQAPQVDRDGQAPAFALPALAGTIRLLRGDIGGTIANERLALAGVPDEAPWALAPRMVLASGLWWSGRPGDAAEADHVLDDAARVARQAGSPVIVAYALGIRAAIALDDEDQARAAAFAREAVAVTVEAGLEEHAWTSMAQVCDGLLSARAGDLRGGAAAIEHALALGERLGAWQVMVSALLALAEVRQRLRDATGARRQLARAREILARLPDPGDGDQRLQRTEKALRLRLPARPTVAAPQFWELSPREVEVLRLLPSSLSQRELAAELYVSFNTIRTHTRVIFSKLGVGSRAEAVTRARELGLIGGDHTG